jgi:RNA polymerase sigma factor (sigma-70 family)
MRPAPPLFEEVFDDLYGRAYRVAYRILQDRGEAEDVAQEALIRAYQRWRKIWTYAPQWVMRVSGNLAIDRARSRTRRQAREQRAAGVTPGATASRPMRGTTARPMDAMTAGTADGAAGGTTIDQPTETTALSNALLSLPDRQREVVMLRYLADLSEATVGQLLGCSPGTVKTHAARGLQALRSALGEPG